MRNAGIIRNNKYMLYGIEISGSVFYSNYYMCMEVLCIVDTGRQ